MQALPGSRSWKHDTFLETPDRVSWCKEAKPSDPLLLPPHALGQAQRDKCSPAKPPNDVYKDPQHVVATKLNNDWQRYQEMVMKLEVNEQEDHDDDRDNSLVDESPRSSVPSAEWRCIDTFHLPR